MIRFSTFLFFSILLFSCQKEEGCVDPVAINFNPNASSDDGSCVYSNAAGNLSLIINYSTNDGLIDNFVECIDVDIDNNVWVGTPYGVQKFDGTLWTTYNTSNSIGLVNNNIKVIKAMENGDVWIGTDYGASKFNGSTWTSYTSPNTLISNQVKSIDGSPYNENSVWIGTSMGVSYYDGQWNSIGSANLHWSGVNSVVHSISSSWLAHPLGGVTNYDGNNLFSNYDTSNGIISQNITDLIIDDLGNKWIGTGGGISVLGIDNNILTNHTRMYLMPPPDTLNPVVQLANDSWNRIWTAIYVGYLAEGGVACWNGEQWIDYDISDGLAGSNIKGLAIDLDDNVWVATTTGISKMIID